MTSSSLNGSIDHTPRPAGNRSVPRISRSTMVEALLCAGAILFATVLWWAKLYSLWGDSSRWIFEAYRVSLGEVPYRDFSWQYPPLSILLAGWLFRIFGSNISTVQAFASVFSAAIILLVWRAGTRILPGRLAVVTTVAYLAGEISLSGNTGLFSLNIYSPGFLTGGASVLLLLILVIDHVRGMHPTSWRILLFVVAVTGCLTSKHEYAAAAVLCVAAASVSQIYSSNSSTAVRPAAHLAVLLAATLPSVAMLGVLGYLSGPRLLIAGLSGYNIATRVCPWWPTGFGLFGAAAALGGALFLALVLSLPVMRALLARYRGGLIAFVVLSIGGGALWAVFTKLSLPQNAGLRESLNYLTSLQNILLPVMWAAVVWFAVEVAGVTRSIVRGWPVAADRFERLVILAVPVGLSVRSLFNGVLAQGTQTEVAAWPALALAGPYLAVEGVRRMSLRSGLDRLPWQKRLQPVLLAAIAAFAILRLGAGIAMVREAHFVKLSTPAGGIWLYDKHGEYDFEAGVYRLISQQTREGDYVLDVNYGGLVNVLCRRNSPIFTTQFVHWAPSDDILRGDLTMLQKHPPKMVIASMVPNFGAVFGPAAYTGCNFPTFEWRLSRPAFDAGKTFPVLEQIAAGYAIAAVSGPIAVYMPKSSARAGHTGLILGRNQ